MQDVGSIHETCNCFHLVVALPSPGHIGAPRGLFYPNTDLGRATAETFAVENRRPGYDVFETAYLFDDADVNMSTFNTVIREMGYSDE